MGENKSRDRYIAGGIKWCLKDLHIIRRLRSLADSREKNTRLKGRLVTRWFLEWRVVFAISHERSHKGGGGRATDQPTDRPTRWITAIKGYMQRVLQRVQYRKWSRRAPFRGTAFEKSSYSPAAASVSCLHGVSILPAVIFSRIYFSRGRESAECQSRHYLLLRDVKRMLSTWAARSSIIIKPRGMIERCRLLIIAFHRVAAGRQVCSASRISTVPPARDRCRRFCVTVARWFRDVVHPRD